MALDIIDFVNARLNDDEQAAKSAIDPERPGAEWHWVTNENDTIVAPGDLDEAQGYQVVSLRTKREFPSRYGGSLPAFVIGVAEEVQSGAGELIVRFDPARVLREVAAKRAILAEHEDDEDQCSRCLDSDGVMWDGEKAVTYTEMWPCRTIRALASVYADHPDFNPSWTLRS